MQNNPQPYQPVPQQDNAPERYNVEMGMVGDARYKSPYPVRMVCPYCQQEGFTRVEMKNGRVTWTFCVLAGFVLMCCIPLTADAYRYRLHYCQRCQGIVGQRVPCMP